MNSNGKGTRTLPCAIEVCNGARKVYTLGLKNICMHNRCVCVCVCACVRACVRSCVCACARACVHACGGLTQNEAPS